jgi:hypothetical protein
MHSDSNTDELGEWRVDIVEELCYWTQLALSRPRSGRGRMRGREKTNTNCVCHGQ